MAQRDTERKGLDSSISYPVNGSPVSGAGSDRREAIQCHTGTGTSGLGNVHTQFSVLQLRDDQARMAAVWTTGSNLRLEIECILIKHNFQGLRKRRDSHVPLKRLSEIGNAGGRDPGKTSVAYEA